MEKTNNPLNLITFGKSVTRPEALETMPAAKLMAMLQNGRWRKPIEAIRGEKNPTLQKEMKLRLPYFVYGVLEGPRSEENVRQVNGIVFDFDRVGDFTAAKQKLMDAAPWFRWLFRSPVDGLKLMVPFSRPVTDKAEYTRIWKLLKAEIEAKSGLKADNTPDLCRACFLSWDDDVITCPEEWQKDLDEYLREAEMIGVSDGDAGVERGNNTSCSPCSQRSLDSRAGWTPGYTDLDEVQAKSAVEYLALRKIDRRDWIRCGIALYNHFGEDGIVYWLQFAYNPNYDDTPEDLRKVWQRLKKYPGVGLGTLFYVAEQYGWINAIQVPAAGKEVAALAEAPDKEGMGGAAALTGGAATASTERPSPPAHTCTSSRTTPSLRGGIDPGSTQGQNGWIPGQARNDVDFYPSGDDVDSYPSDRDVSSDSSGRDVNSNPSGGAATASTERPSPPAHTCTSSRTSPSLRGGIDPGSTQGQNGWIPGQARNDVDFYPSGGDVNSKPSGDDVDFYPSGDDVDSYPSDRDVSSDSSGRDVNSKPSDREVNSNPSGGAATASTERPSPPAHTCTSSRTSPSLRGGIDPGSTHGQNGWIPGQARNDVDFYPSDRDVSSDSSGRDVNSNPSGGAATASTERPSPPAHTCTSSRTSPSLRGGIDPGSTQGQNGWIPGQARNDVDSYPSGDDVDSYPSDRDVSSDSSGRDVNSNSSGRDVNTNPSGGDGVTPSRPSTLSRAEGLTLADFPELLELFRRPQNIHLDREQLPEAINAYLDLVGRITDAQNGAKLTAFLPVVAANIGNRVYMYNAGTRHYCNIWAAIIGPSTVSRKTTVINQAMKMLQPFKESLRELSPKERNEQDIELSRVTQARLYNLLAINPNRLILQMELSAWMREMGKSYNAGMKQEITDMFDGKDRSIAKMEIDEHIAKPAFSIVGATTEDWFFQELREVADQRGGFLQRFIICIIQNIDVKELRLQSVDASECDRELAQWDEMLATFRALPDSRRLAASEEASAFRDSIYADLMKAIALNANDPQAAYCARIFDNYFWRFCILIFLLKNWRDLREAAGNDRLQTWFLKNKVDGKTAREAWYLCQYYYENTRPFLKQLTEGSKLDEERKILRLLQKAPEQEMTHSRLLNKSRMTSREFRNCIQSLIERQAILCHEHRGTNNKIALEYSLNPVLAGIDIS